MHKGVIAGIIVAVIAIGGYLASPLVYEKEVDESLPVALNKIAPGLTLEKFSNMDDQIRQVLITKMSDKVKDKIMEESGKMSTSVSEGMDEMPTPVSEGMDEMMDKEPSEPSAPVTVKSGMFEGLAGHQAQGIAKIIHVDGSTFLRFEDFEVTNGPDLRVYITQNGDVHDGIHLEKLKGSRGDQNYSLENIDVQVYNTVVIYCQPFGVYFGQAQLN